MTSITAQPMPPRSMPDLSRPQNFIQAWDAFFSLAPLLDRSETAEQMSALREAGATPPLNFFQNLAQEGNAQSLLGALEGMPSLLKSPHLPQAFEAYADDMEFIPGRESSMEKAFCEAMLMGMSLAGQNPANFSHPFLRALVEAANLAQVANTSSQKPKGRL